jgi:hypothetical protein
MGNSIRELVWGVAELLGRWENGGGGRMTDQAEKIVSWVLAHKRLHEVLAEGVRPTR